ncbi:hypothetical protein [Thermococcus sp.]|uniref:hypothetical protein n=1 Tax=Thermococcus sp. TaxID=35749 RepID=UPI0026303ADA|nr:hypothetical protein [Thermococcus sp.]
MKDPKKVFLLKYVKEPKTAGYVYLRENETMVFLANKLAEQYGLGSRQKVYELALLSVALGVPPEKLAPFLQKRTKANSRKVLFEVYEALLEAEL